MVKIVRSFPAPVSLQEEAKKMGGSYEKDDVVEQLKKDFHNKCYICEMDKLQDPQVEHLLPHKDCCKTDPEEVISFQLKNENVHIFARDEKDKNALLTAELVTEVFSLKNTSMRVYKSEMRFEALTEEMNKLYDSIEELQNDPDSRVAKRKIKALLRKESRFAAFKREYIRENQPQYRQLLDNDLWCFH